MFYPIDSVLVERFAQQNGTVFVGAGVSLGSRLPTWGELMKHLRLDLGDEISSSSDYLHIAELYEIKHNRSALIQYLKDRLGDVRFQLTKTHELIVELPVQRIYTTNFDTLLEQASQKKQINRNVIVNASHVGFSDTSTLSIVKLHGDFADPDSIVISARDFYSYFSRNPVIANLLKVELQTHTVLFLGYSFSDPNLGMILGNAAVQSGSSRPLLYSLQFNPTELAVQALNSRGVKVIRLEVNPGTAEADEAIEDWLRSFRQSLTNFERRKSRYAGGKRQPRESDLPFLRKNAIRRMKMSERIRAGLASDFRVVVVKGEAGIGKTQLVAEIAEDCLHAAPTFRSDAAFERVIWIRASFEVEGMIGHTLKGILDAIASNVDTLLVSRDADDLKQTRAEINVALQERRLLVVIEDFEVPVTCSGESDKVARALFEEIKDWLENAGRYANPMSRIIVTSRSAIVAGFVVEIAKLEIKEAIEVLRDHARAIMLRRDHVIFNQQLEKKLLALSEGNPQAIKLALGLCKGTRKPAKALHDLGERLGLRHGMSDKIDSVFNIMVDTIVDALNPASNLETEPESACDCAFASDIVIAMTVFPTEEWVPESLVLAALDQRMVVSSQPVSFAEAMARCLRFGLLERDVCTNKYSMPRIIRDVLRSKASNEKPVHEARERLAAYLLTFIANTVRRPGIERYWNAMVCDEMARLDDWWPIIDVVMYYPEGGARAVDFALLMVHYMDSRFLNNQRMKFIGLALKNPDALDIYTRALLHIDALAWTFMEEGANQKARSEIDKGLKLLNRGAPGNAKDLKALAHAWRARIDASEGKNLEARSNIEEAFKWARQLKDKPWIRMRVEMMAGDVDLMNDHAREAIRHYTRAAVHAELYGGEGDGYQTNPRIGLALLQICKDGKPHEDSMEKARRRFMQLIDNSRIATGKLYGQYGMALIADHENSTGEARRQLQQLQKEIRHRSRGNVLLKLAEQAYEKISSTGRKRS